MNLLEKIALNTEPKSSLQIVVSGNKTRLVTKFSQPIELDKKKQYEIALVNLETYYSFPNVDSTNNNFRYSPDEGATWFDINIPEGSYEITHINNYIQRIMKESGHYDSENNLYNITLSANTNTLKAVVILADKYQVDFRPIYSIGRVLGFTSRLYIGRYQESENIVDILNINSILVNIDIIAGSFVNGSIQPTIYSFFPNVSPGYKIIETPHNLVYLPVTRDKICSILTTLTDQNGKELNLCGETVTIRFHLREI